MLAHERLECVRIALNMHSSGQREFTAKDVVASARIIERYVGGTKRGKKADNAATFNQFSHLDGTNLASSGMNNPISVTAGTVGCANYDVTARVES